ncbi:MAG: hypothetical protein H6500_07295 [Candidatus Woesearchaeota archaeon]|nr:MAG: hypothetical protein H6500_07295 [Candidatus Woesearchaeota archaeon]
MVFFDRKSFLGVLFPDFCEGFDAFRTIQCFYDREGRYFFDELDLRVRERIGGQPEDLTPSHLASLEKQLQALDLVYSAVSHVRGQSLLKRTLVYLTTSVEDLKLQGFQDDEISYLLPQHSSDMKESELFSLSYPLSSDFKSALKERLYSNVRKQNVETQLGDKSWGRPVREDVDAARTLEEEMLSFFNDPFTTQKRRRIVEKTKLLALGLKELEFEQIGASFQKDSSKLLLLEIPTPSFFEMLREKIEMEVPLLPVIGRQEKKDVLCAKVDELEAYLRPSMLYRGPQQWRKRDGTLYDVQEQTLTLMNTGLWSLFYRVENLKEQISRQDQISTFDWG